MAGVSLNQEAARARMALLHDPTLPSCILRRAAQELLPDGDEVSIDTLDPETARMFLLDVWRVPVATYEKIQAAIVGRELPQRWCSSAGVFCALARVFNDLPAMPDKLTLLEPHELAWAVIELEIHQAEAYPNSGFDLQAAVGPEVRQWTAACLLDEGMVVAPPELAFCQPYLDAANHAPALAEQVRAHLLRDVREFPETPLGVQLQHHALVRAYVTQRSDALARALETF